MGQTLEARFRMDCSCEPAKLDIEVLPQGSSCPPPAIPYIFKFQGAALVLCGPSDGRMQRPQSFDGPGLCVMNFSTPRTERHIFEPDPEFSRVSTEDHQQIAKVFCAPTKVEVTKTGVAHWIEEPAIVASMALAVTSTIIALKKSL